MQVRKNSSGKLKGIYVSGAVFGVKENSGTNRERS